MSNNTVRPHILVVSRILAKLSARRLSVCIERPVLGMQIELLQQRVARNPFDNESWELLIEELVLVRKQPQGEARLKETLQSCVGKYPTAVRFLQISPRFANYSSNLNLMRS
jgi:hypothetical protein